MDNDVGQAPAMGASKIGILIPNLRANSCARRTELEFIMLDSLRLTRSLLENQKFQGNVSYHRNICFPRSGYILL